MKNRKSTNRKLQNNSSRSSHGNSKLFDQEISKCPMVIQGCQSVIIGNNALLVHLETECNYFISNASEKVQKKIEEKVVGYTANNLIKLLLNQVKSTPMIETIDRTFIPSKMSTQYDVTTKKPDRFPKMTIFKKIELIKEFEDTETIELGNVPMKSNLTCAFTINKNKTSKLLVAYRSHKFSIVIKDMYGNTIKRLEGHTDHITEIKYFRNEKEESFLYSSSFDNKLIVWSLDTYEAKYIIDYKSWILSSSLVLLRKQNCSLAIISGGYYKKHPIGVYNLKDGSLEFEIPIELNVSIEIIQTLADEDQGKYYLFLGTDNEKPMILWYDFRLKNLIMSFQTNSKVTSITIEHSNKYSVMIFTDLSGGLKQVDLIQGKIIADFKQNAPILDLIIWDNDYFIICGSHKDNSIKILTRQKTRLVKSFDNLHSKVIVNLSKYYHYQNGLCLVTIGGDKRIKLMKLS